MYENPKSLEDICLETICENILTYIVPQTPTKEAWCNTTLDIDGSDCYDDERWDKRYTFRNPDIYLINEISEKLLNRMMKKQLLCDATLNIFSSKNTQLKVLRIKNCKVSKNGLQILKEHKIVDIEAVNLKTASIIDVLDCLSDWSQRNMVNANFSKCTFAEKISSFSYMLKMTNFKNLRSINLAQTELNQTIFIMMCEDMKLLKKINISGTKVRDLRPLRLLSDNLISLSIGNLTNAWEHLLTTLLQLKHLRHLDISLYNQKPHVVDLYSEITPFLLEFLENDIVVPHLVSLDLSGWMDIRKKSLLKFIHNHKKLEFLGIVLTSLNFDIEFSDMSNSTYPKHLTIAGLGNDEQIKVTLQKYQDRSNYVQKALYHLFQWTSTFSQARPDLFNLVLPVMEVHLSWFGVQMAATACLYNLTRGELSKSVHPSALSKGVALTLIAMETFSDEFQLQKNSLLTLCSDRILHDVNFDRFRCARLVLEALCGFEDINMNRMAVAIVSILAAKVSTEETSELGSHPHYMRKLLSMVQNRVESKVSDITLKFTLSALWNLTDESSATCTVFLEQGGAWLFLNVLKAFKGDSTIETKVLGLLNNIAEVARLRSSLLLDSLIEELHELLESQYIDVSYFAAGIVAHLASDGIDMWTVKSYARIEILEGLESAVKNWNVPESEMVAYRSFRPFFPLLKVEMDYQVQLWAVWAIHHVCTKNPKRYCPMLCEENGNLLLAELINYKETNVQIREICQQILNALEMTNVT